MLQLLRRQPRIEVCDVLPSVRDAVSQKDDTLRLSKQFHSACAGFIRVTDDEVDDTVGLGMDKVMSVRFGSTLRNRDHFKLVTVFLQPVSKYVRVLIRRHDAIIFGNDVQYWDFSLGNDLAWSIGFSL